MRLIALYKSPDARRWFDRRGILMLSAVSLLVIAMPVLAGWWLHAPHLISLADFPSAIMTFNSAVLFVACACALVLFLFNQRGSAGFLGLLIVVASGVILVEHGVGKDLGIDQLVVKDWLTAPGHFPGRMPVGTALSFVLAGVAVFVLASKRDHSQRHAIVGVVGVILIVFGVLALAWPGIPASGMATKTALAFVALGTGFVAIGWASEGVSTGVRGASWLPLGLGVAIFLGAVVLWQVLLQAEKTHVAALTAANAPHVTKELITGMKERVQALQRMAQRAPLFGAKPTMWSSDAKQYMQGFPAITRLEWRDAGGLRRAVPPGETELMPHPTGNKTSLFFLAEETKKTILVIDVPLAGDSSNRGYVRAALDPQVAFSRILDTDIAPGYAAILLAGGREIFRQGEIVPGWQHELELDLLGIPLTLQIGPMADLLQRERSSLPGMVFAMGAVLSLLLAVAVRFAQQAHLRARLLGRSNGELERSERKYRHLMEQAADGIFVSDRLGNYVDVNARACSMTGYTRHELLRLNVADILAPDDLAARPVCADEIFAGRALTIERRILRKDGVQVTVETSVRATVDGLMLAIVRDISERRRTEALNLRLGRMLDGLVSEIFVLDAQTLSVVQANQGACRALGCTLDDLQPVKLSDLQPEITAERFAKLAAPLLSGDEQQIVYEALQRRKNGLPYRVEGRLQWLSDEVPPVFILTVQDVTERRNAEAEMRKLSSAVEQADDPVMITDVAGIIEYVNPAFQRVTGFNAEEALGRTPNLLRSNRQDGAFYARLWKTILAGEPFRDVLINRRKDGTLYFEEKLIMPLKDDRGAITHFISTGKDVTAHQHVQERLRHLYKHDLLTQLPNGSVFIDHLTRAIPRMRTAQRQLAVLYLNLDRFASVNESLGYGAGDAILQSVAQRLRESARQQDMVARLGDDRFGLILEDVGDDEVKLANDTASIAQNLLAMLSMPHRFEEQAVTITASIGIARFPDDAQDSGTLMRLAEAAMERTNKRAGNSFCYHEHETSERALARLDLRADLPGALERREFLLHYQPVLDLKSRRIECVEAMLRWKHPKRGIIPARDFVPLLESSELIVAAGAWVLRAACQQAAAWHATGLPTLPVAVNVSALDFSERDYAAVVGQVLDETGLAPRYLQLELDEKMLNQAASGLRKTLEALREMGITLVLNHFDVGLSSLGVLKQYPITAMKVLCPKTDADAALLSAIVAIAHRLGLRIVAGHAESKQQLRMLETCGCDSVQGRAVTLPLAPMEVARWLQRGFAGARR